MQINSAISQQSRLLLFFFALAITVITSITYYTVKNTYNNILEFQALNVAEIVATQAMISRSVYSKIAVGKLKKDGTGGHIDSNNQAGHIPLPAQFLKQLAKESNKIEHDLYNLKPLSKWNLEPNQGLSDAFQMWAWTKLEEQDKASPSAAINWQPAWRFEDIDGDVYLRYLKADPASGTSCINCHNAYEATPEVMQLRKSQGEATGKQWSQHQLLGALEVQIPLRHVKVIADAQTRNASLTIIGTILALVLVVCWFSYRNVTCFRDMGKMSNMIIKDPLTGTLNRRGFDLRLREFIYSAQNHYLHHALVYLDLDYFKQVNDVHGHAAGDMVLQTVTKIMHSKIRETDAVFRLGGDEFAILLESCSLEQAKQISQSIMDELAENPVEFNGQTISVTLSMGISVIEPETASNHRFIEEADKALYKAKEAGRNQIAV